MCVPVCLYVHLCVSVCTCVYLCVSVCTCVYLCVPVRTCVYLCDSVRIYVRQILLGGLAFTCFLCTLRLEFKDNTHNTSD
jgi:hypothetical protein